MPKIQPYLFGNGGPIIMVQVENEYGSFRKISEKYKFWLSQEIGNSNLRNFNCVKTLNLFQVAM